MDFGHPYLTRQLIAYIGSKRTLLPFIHEAFARIGAGSDRVLFADPFAGSGAVSRLARLLGWEVLANDWEPYSFAINSCHLAVRGSRLATLFRDRGGVERVLAELNALEAPAEDRRYISRHYAPRSTAGADWRTERLFYTAENALAIDAIRDRIEEWYPGEPGAGDPGDDRAAEKHVLLAPLLYEAATHTNTSGVFKACHRGFGGHGADALGRIMRRIELEPPALLDCSRPARVFCQDAERFLAGRTVDVCYLDPPYTVHQYGSNYFMLNTIARWDRPAVSEERGADGRLLHKAGIRADWRATHSAFCCRRTALAAMRATVDAADCRWLCLSYGADGLIGLEELCDLLASTGRLELLARDHVKYPGGKGSIRRSNRSVELLLVVDRRRRSSAEGRRRARSILAERELASLLASAFHPRRIRERFRVEAASVLVSTRPRIDLPTWRLYRFLEPPEKTRTAIVGLPAFPRILKNLRACLVADREEEVGVLLGLVRAAEDPSEQRRLEAGALRLLTGFAHRKYRTEYRRALAAMRDFARGEPRAAWMNGPLDRLETIARRRGI